MPSIRKIKAVKVMDTVAAQSFINNKDKNDGIKNDGNTF
jgi:hypothetical protein